MPLPVPLTEGRAFSFKSLTIQEGTEVVSRGLQSCKISVSIEGREFVRDTGRKPIARTAGDQQVEVECNWDWTYLSAYIAEHPACLDEEHNFTFLWSEGAYEAVVEVIGLAFDKFEISSEGTEGIKVPKSGFAMDVLVDGESVIQEKEAEQRSVT